MSWENLEGISPGVFNQQFLSKLAEDPAPLKQTGDNFVRDRLREDMVFNAVLPQTTIGPERLQVSETSDTLHELIYIEPNAHAIVADFRGQGRSEIIRGPRALLGFHMLKSAEFEAVEQELLVYPYPIVRLIHDFGIKAIGDQHDLYMLQLCQDAVDYVDANTDYKDKWGAGSVRGLDTDGSELAVNEKATVDTANIVALKKSMSNRIKPEVMIITKYDHDDIDALSIQEQGDILKSEVFIDGYKQPTWTGLKMVVTTKQDIFQPGNIWAFAKPEFLGKNRVLDYGGSAYKLFIDRRSNVITWHTYINVGAGIYNVGSLAKLKLYGSDFDADPGNDPNTIVDADLFQQRNRVDDGGKFPDIRQF